MVCGTHSLQQLALHQWFDHVVGGGEVPGLVDEVHRFETGRERILADKEKGRRLASCETDGSGARGRRLTCNMSTIFFSSVGLIPDACCMVKPLKFSMMQNPLI